VPTVPASKLIEPIADRTPAILEDEDWSVWLGKESAELDHVKATLRTVEGVNWKMAKEPKQKGEKPANVFDRKA